MTAREFRCVRCNELRVASTSTGPLPSVCDACDPEAAIRRMTAREQAQARHARQRVEIESLRARVRDLEDLLESAKTYELDEPRRELARAVRAVGHAQGRFETRDALLQLRDIAHSWASSLGVSRETDPTEALAA